MRRPEPQVPKQSTKDYHRKSPSFGTSPHYTPPHLISGTLSSVIFSILLPSRSVMAPSQPSQNFRPAPQKPSHKPQGQEKSNARLPMEYSRQTQHQNELAHVGDQKSRFELAKAYYDEQMAAERKVQSERVKRKREQERADRKRRQTERIASIHEENQRPVVDLHVAANASTGPVTRSQVRRAAEVVNLTSDDGDGDEDSALNNNR